MAQVEAKLDILRSLEIAEVACANSSWDLLPTEYADVQQVCNFLSFTALIDDEFGDRDILQDLLLNHQLVQTLARAVRDGLSWWRRQQQQQQQQQQEQQQSSGSKPTCQTQQHSSSDVTQAIAILTMLSGPLNSCLIYAAGPLGTNGRAECAKQVEASGGQCSRLALYNTVRSKL
jgi:hypothetical protein